MITTIVFIFGLVFGSFYNVVGLRLPNNESLIKPGSHCPKCNHNLSWYENIPVLSYLFLGGKCKNCKCTISPIYPLIELLTGILFAISYTMFGFEESFFISVIVSSLVVVIFVSDSKYMIISDSPLVVSSILILVVKFYYHGYKECLTSLGSGLLIFGVMYLIMLMGNALFKKESLGGGDIKLSFVAGLALGPVIGVTYIILASFLAFPYAIYITIKNQEGMLPFGPFLATSLLVLFMNFDFAMNIVKTILHIQ